jgi:hypothetical protein
MHMPSGAAGRLSDHDRSVARRHSILAGRNRWPFRGGCLIEEEAPDGPGGGSMVEMHDRWEPSRHPSSSLCQ